MCCSNNCSDKLITRVSSLRARKTDAIVLYYDAANENISELLKFYEDIVLEYPEYKVVALPDTICLTKMSKMELTEWRDSISNLIDQMEVE